MRPLLHAALGLLLGAASCSLYAPTVPDCTVKCGEGGACPSGFTCRGTYCRPSTGTADDCACGAGSTQPCGPDGGECRLGTQLCSPSGEWGACTGAVWPSEEVCDGKDNDCDGLTDEAPPVKLFSNTGPAESHWELHAHDGGYIVLTPLALEDGGQVTRALRYGRRFEPLGETEPLNEGYWRRTVGSMEDGVLFTASSDGEDRAGLAVSRVEPDGTLTRVGTVADAGYDRKIHLATGPRGLVTAYVTPGDTVRTAKWPRDGGVPDALTDVAPLAEGDFSTLSCTNDGQYLVIEHALADGGYLEAVQDIDAAAPARLDAPYWNLNHFVVRKPGRVAHVDTLIPGPTGLPDPNATTPEKPAVYFFFDYAGDQTFKNAFTVEGPGDWTNLDFMLDADDSLVAAYMNTQTELMTLARIRGKGTNDQQATRREFTKAELSVPVSASGNFFNLAHVPGDDMIGIVWTTGDTVYGRRLCAPDTKVSTP